MEWGQNIFSVPLVKLDGEVFMPQPEVKLERRGVSDVFLEHAENYFVRFENFDYLYTLIENTFKKLKYTPSGVVVDFGSGFGNSVIPLLQNYDVQVVATDISPQLLQILKRESHLRGFHNRCFAVAQDAQNCYFTPSCADLVMGCAILHHTINPMAVVKAALTVLKPGGKAIFFEPFELGHQILNIAYSQVIAEAKRRKVTGAGIDFLSALCQDISARTHRDNTLQYSGIWKNLDDKWMFCQSHFKKISNELGCQIEILPLHDNDHQFTRQTKVALEAYGGLTCPDALPTWAWDIIKDFDEKYFSPEGLSDLPIEACVVITAPRSLN